MFKIVGNIEGLSVLGLAYGEGFYTRLYKLYGAVEVVGIDLSTEMIVLANEAEDIDKFGITYLVGDAMELDLGKSFVIVFSMIWGKQNEMLYKPMIIKK